ncbi:MAG: xanthine dehydrogenase family protein subunit M [Candidatus Bipolaricaulota bacterium]|nr:xanthine dehydrogenase family protein subunit M [Candidatus Bipolaricaulota bacterium]
MIGEFEYVRVESIAEGCSLLAEHAGNAAVLAGGTDLLVNIRNGTAPPNLLVDFKRIEELKAFLPDKGVIGSSVPLNMIAEDRIIQERYRGLAEAAQNVGSYQIRNRATLAGNLCNASPAADMAPPLFVLNAHVTIAGPHGTRTLPVQDLFVGVKKNSLSPGEIIVSITLPPALPQVRTKFLKIQRIRGHDLAIINMAGYLDIASGELRIAIGSCAVTPILLPSLDEPVNEDASIDALVEKLNALAQSAITPISDLRGSAEYRWAMVPVLLRKLMIALLSPKGEE